MSWSAAATGRSRRGGTATRDEDWEKADGLLALGGVGELGDRPFGVISEGERQQVLLARALMSDPELLLLDEPFAGLDLGARERLLVRLTALAADPGSPPIVLVTHHCEEIPPGFTHGGLVSGGELVAAGPLSGRRHLGARLGLLRGARSRSAAPTGAGGAAPPDRRSADSERGVRKRALIQLVAEGTNESNRRSADEVGAVAFPHHPPLVKARSLGFLPRAKVGRRGVTIVILLVLVVLLWVAVLAPSAWRRFGERQGVGSIDHFHHQLQLLEHAGPKTVAPAYRLHTALPGGESAEATAELRVDSSRPKLVLLRPTEDAAAADVDGGDGSHYERVGVLDRPEPAACPEVSGGACRRSAVNRRDGAAPCCCAA